MRAPGSFTSLDIDSITGNGPIEPATNRGLWGSLAVHVSAAARAMRAPSRVMSRTAAARPYSAWPMEVAEKVLVSLISAPAAK